MVCSKALICIWVAWLVFCSSEACNSVVYVGSSCSYAVDNLLSTYEQALNDASANGGSLITAKTAERNNTINFLLQRQCDSFWIGARHIDGQWTWVDGVAMSEGVFLPANRGKCLVARRISGEYSWIQVDCNEQHPFLYIRGECVLDSCGAGEECRTNFDECTTTCVSNKTTTTVTATSTGVVTAKITTSGGTTRNENTMVHFVLVLMLCSVALLQTRES